MTTPPPRTPADWERVQRIGLINPSMTMEQYSSKVQRGVEMAEDYLARGKALVPSIDQIQDAHAFAFGRVHSWAGTLRKTEVCVGDIVCTHPKEIRSELARLEALSKHIFKDNSPENRLKAIAFYHSNFEEIHPFLDGNGRIGRAITRSQMAISFGKFPSLDMDRTSYIQALKQAQQNENYLPLAKIFAANIEQSKSLEHSQTKENTRER